jgi:hypothetical protein
MINEYEFSKPDVVRSTPLEGEKKKSIFSSLLDKINNWIFERSFYIVEPEISRKYDRNGNLWWYVRDPATGETAWLDTEDEVRIWLDRPYRFNGSRKRCDRY